MDAHAHSPADVKTGGPDLLAFTRVVREVRDSASWLDVQPWVVQLIGPWSFSAGVGYGIGEDIVHAVVDVAQLVKTLALAEIADASLPGVPTWRAVVGDASFLALAPLIPLVRRGAVAYFEAELRQAQTDRAALFAAVRHVFEHPGEFFQGVVDGYANRWSRLQTHLGKATVSDQFQAGCLFGGFLLEVLSLLATAGALARLAAKVPQLTGQLLRRLEKAGEAVARRAQRGALSVRGAASEGVPPTRLRSTADPAVAGEKPPPPPPRVRVLKQLSAEEQRDWYRINRRITSEAKLDDMVASADAKKPVELVVVPEGSTVVQYVRENGTVGAFFSEPGVSPASLAISGEGRVMRSFVLTEDVTAVRSTAAPFPEGKYPGVGGPGGGTQYVFPESAVPGALK